MAVLFIFDLFLFVPCSCFLSLRFVFFISWYSFCSFHVIVSFYSCFFIFVCLFIVCLLFRLFFHLFIHVFFAFLRLDGSITGGERQHVVDQFTKNKEFVVFLLSTRAGGQGINLQTGKQTNKHKERNEQTKRKK
jgi:hypothetical protein